MDGLARPNDGPFAEHAALWSKCNCLRCKTVSIAFMSLQIFLLQLYPGEFESTDKVVDIATSEIPPTQIPTEIVDQSSAFPCAKSLFKGGLVPVTLAAALGSSRSLILLHRSKNY